MASKFDEILREKEGINQVIQAEMTAQKISAQLKTSELETLKGPVQQLQSEANH